MYNIFATIPHLHTAQSRGWIFSFRKIAPCASIWLSSRITATLLDVAICIYIRPEERTVMRQMWSINPNEWSRGNETRGQRWVVCGWGEGRNLEGEITYLGSKESCVKELNGGKGRKDWGLERKGLIDRVRWWVWYSILALIRLSMTIFTKVQNMRHCTEHIGEP